MPFLIFLKSFEVLLYEIMSWLVFYPRTMWRAVRHPLRLMERTEEELAKLPEEQFRDVVSPPIFLLLTVVAANTFEVLVTGSSPLIDNGIGLAAMITDNTSLILFRLVAFASLPVIAAVFALVVMRKEVDRDSLQPVFYAQCFATTPVVLLFSVGETATRLPQRAVDYVAGALFTLATLFYLGVQASWFAKDAKRPRSHGLLWAVMTFVMSVLVLGGTALLFSGV